MFRAFQNAVVTVLFGVLVFGKIAVWIHSVECKQGSSIGFDRLTVKSCGCPSCPVGKNSESGNGESWQELPADEPVERQCPGGCLICQSFAVPTGLSLPINLYHSRHCNVEKLAICHRSVPSMARFSVLLARGPPLTCA